MRSDKQKEIEKVIPSRFFDETNEIKPKIYNPKPMRDMAPEKNETYDEELTMEIAENIINSFYFTGRILNAAFNFDLDSHQINHINSQTNIKPNYTETEEI